MGDNPEPKIVLTDAPDPAHTAVIQRGCAPITPAAGYDDSGRSRCS
jgi:hypothetical protein